MIMKKNLVLISTILMVACSAKIIMPTQADVERANVKFPGISLSDLNEGKIKFEQNCGSCHSLNESYHESEKGLRRIMPEMAQKAKIDAKAEDQILKYLITMNSAPKK